MNSFQVGDVVELKSGGVKMTINYLNVNQSSQRQCEWFVDKNVRHESRFLPELLKKIPFHSIKTFIISYYLTNKATQDQIENIEQLISEIDHESCKCHPTMFIIDSILNSRDILKKFYHLENKGYVQILIIDLISKEFSFLKGLDTKEAVRLREAGYDQLLLTKGDFEEK